MIPEKLQVWSIACTIQGRRRKPTTNEKWSFEKIPLIIELGFNISLMLHRIDAWHRIGNAKV